ncbi:hypothetical protein [Thiobacillus denitrificans]|uniref:hypothetical protein n=1 Tax=Thiobacillus denitrificans TaxID=36861 RepID=UPI000A496BEB|nr:hypothetical protein [Thiobacillus denitrificans]
MIIITITHPHAAQAIRLAQAAQYLDRATVARILARTGTPRALYTLARVLRAAA